MAPFRAATQAPLRVDRYGERLLASCYWRAVTGELLLASRGGDGLARCGDPLDERRDQGDRRDADEGIHDARQRAGLAESVAGERGDEVELEETDEQPVQATDDDEEEEDGPEHSHDVDPFAWPL